MYGGKPNTDHENRWFEISKKNTKNTLREAFAEFQAIHISGNTDFTLCF
jgi:hypothetical protein